MTNLEYIKSFAPDKFAQYLIKTETGEVNTCNICAYNILKKRTCAGDCEKGVSLFLSSEYNGELMDKRVW